MEERYEIDVQLDKKTLDRFLIRNNFLRAGGVAGLLISFAGNPRIDCVLERICCFPTGNPCISGSDVYCNSAIWHFAERMEPIKKRCIPQTISLYFFRRGD